MAEAVQAATRRNEDIEILRGFSVILVLYEHIPAITGSSSIGRLRGVFTGWTGVDLFFCISGFVIYRSLYGRIYPGMLVQDFIRQIVAFWLRRVWRLVPTAWLWLAFGLVLAFTASRAEVGLRIDNIVDALSAVLNFANFHQYYCISFQTACGRLFPHFWSLSLEAQFYFALPFVLLFASRRWLCYGLVALIAVQFPIRRPANWTEIAWFIRTDALAWGILIAELSLSRVGPLLRPDFLKHPVARAAFTAGFLFLLGTSQLFWREGFFVGMVAACAACLVWAASYDRGYVWAGIAGRTAMVWVGTRSYSIYVCHLVMNKTARFVLQAIRIADATPAQKTLYVVTALTLTLAAAELTYRFVEVPFRRRGRHDAHAYLIATSRANVAE